MAKLSSRKSLLWLLLLLVACSFSVAREASDGSDALLVSSLRREERATTNEIDEASAQPLRQPQQARRQLFDFWSLVFAIGPCPPIGPLHDKCKKDDSDSSTSYSSESNSANSNNNEANTKGGIPTGVRSLSFWMLIAAAAAAALAIAAIVVGSRKSEKPVHPLSGSVARRMELFSNFADCALCDSGMQRPDRVVEMTMSKDDYDMSKKNSALV